MYVSVIVWGGGVEKIKGSRSLRGREMVTVWCRFYARVCFLGWMDGI